MIHSFHGIVARRAEARPDDELVRLAGTPGWTAAALWERALAIAGGLSRYAGPGDAVATCLSPGPEAIAVTTALSALGAIELPLSRDLDVDWVQALSKATSCTTTVTEELGATVVRHGTMPGDPGGDAVLLD